ncbi:MAG: SDR family oxidoreductase [Blastomonas sp.]
MSAVAGKHVFIAGGTSGINLGIARHFAEEGARLSVLSRSQEKVDAAAAELSARGEAARGYAADVRDYAALEAAMADAASASGPIDCVIAGAAGNFLAPAIALSANAFKTVIDIDLLGAFNTFRASWDHLNRPGASLIAISAGQAVTPKPMQAHACAAKAGINMLVKCLALEWGPAGVRVNAISPGPIKETEGMERLAPTPEMEAAIKKRLALRDYGTKQDVASMAAYLASDAASYITGSIMNVDGGGDLGDASVDCLTIPAR